MRALVIVLSKLLIVAAVVGLLRSSARFQSMSRELDERAFAALRRIMNATEECGYPRELVPILMLLTALTFMLSMLLTARHSRNQMGTHRRGAERSKFFCLGLRGGRLRNILKSEHNTLDPFTQ